VHLLSHTHWDREWYKTAEAFRVLLVPLVDAVLARRQPFLLDGQAIVLEDYLGWAPHQREAVSAALRGGWLEAGPWYVLADNSIPGGEALVRNLTLGRQALGALGGGAPSVLYCPDTFGHPDAGPTLSAGFGLPLAVVWRGYGGRGWPAGDSARWRNDAGDEVLLHHLPPSGYEFGASLPSAREAMTARWRSLRDTLAPRSASGQLLILNGADHHAIQPDLNAARAALVDAAAPAAVVETGLAGFARAQVDFAASREVPVARGELRASPGYVWTLGGTMGSRAYQKRRNAQLERLLSQDLEPWLAWCAWNDLSTGREAVGGLWRLLLSSHPHDTLCGCSIDAVAAAMDDRNTRVEAGARALRELALGTVVGVTDDRPNGLEPSRLLVTNPVPRRRTSVVEATVDLPLARVPIGFGSVTGAAAREVPRWSVHRDRPVPMQRLATERVVVRDEARTRYPVTRLADRHHVLLWLEDIPAHGFATLDVVERAGRAQPPASVRTEGSVLDNGTVRVWWDAEHGLCCHGAWGEWRDLLGFESQGERGDLYTHSAIPGTRRAGVVRSARVTLRGPLRGELAVRFRVPIAARTVTHPTGATTRQRPASTDITVRVQLDAGARWFRLVIDGVSKAPDYRLRAVVRTACTGEVHRADAAFTPVTRPSRAPESHDGDVEQIAGTAPLHRYVSCFDAAAGRGVTVYSDGLAESEATPDGAIAVTMLRGVGELSRSDLPERPGHAGYPSPVPRAQCEGPFQAMFALLPHGADHPGTHGEIESVADDVLLPPGASPLRAAAGTRAEGLCVEGEGIRWLGTRPGELAGSLRVRLANVTAHTQHAVLTLAGVDGARRLRLDDTPIGVLPVKENRVRCAIAPYAVATIELARNVPA
jgi:alpha-mannosidase